MPGNEDGFLDVFWPSVGSVWLGCLVLVGLSTVRLLRRFAAMSTARTIGLSMAGQLVCVALLGAIAIVPDHDQPPESVLVWVAEEDPGPDWPRVIGVMAGPVAIAHLLIALFLRKA